MFAIKASAPGQAQPTLETLARLRQGHGRRMTRWCRSTGGPAATCATRPARPCSRWAPQVPFTLEEIDIEADDTLFKRYLERIPVIALDGEELYDFFVDAEDLANRLRKLATRHEPSAT